MAEIHTIDTRFLAYDRVTAGFLIKAKAPEKGDILVDTGSSSTIQTFSKNLERCGSSISNVKHILLTHIHLDHTGAAWIFADAGAKVYVHTLGEPHLADPDRLMRSVGRVYGDKMEQLWGEMRPIAAENLQTIADGDVLDIGGHRFRAHYTPGHAKHHIAWQLDDYLFAGDVAGVRLGKGPAMAPCPPPDIDVPAWKESLRKIAKLDIKRLYITHYGEITENISTHLEHVADHLDEMLAWMTHKHEKKVTGQQLYKQFESDFTKTLQTYGCSPLEVKMYANVLPAYLNVLGIAHYMAQKG